MRSILILWFITALIAGGIYGYAQTTYDPALVVTPEIKAAREAALAADTQATLDNLNSEASSNSNTTADPAADMTDLAPGTVSGTGNNLSGAINRGASVRKEDFSEPDPSELVMNPADPELVEKTEQGPVPVTMDGRQPWDYYARPDNTGNQTPRIAIVISNMGLKATQTEMAISRLPGSISFAFSPQSVDLNKWVNQAHEGTHESLLMVPMEPVDYPREDPGPYTLLTSYEYQRNITNLHHVLSRTNGYVGIINEMGSRFTANRDAMKDIMIDLQRRGLMFLDAHTTEFTVAASAARNAGLPRAIVDRHIDERLTAEDIDRYLGDLEGIANTYGAAVGLGSPYPLTISRILNWAQSLPAKGIKLVPITAVANRQPIR